MQLYCTSFGYVSKEKETIIWLEEYHYFLYYLYKRDSIYIKSG